MRDMIEEMVDELLDMDGTIEIAGSVFSRSAILRELDPTAYRMLCNDTADALIEDLRDELDRLDPVEDFDEVEDLKFRIKEMENI
jgi:hypothetical protein